MRMKRKIVFMGTPSIGASVLKALLKCDVDIVQVVTQPDKKVGRKQLVEAPPVKGVALEHGLSVVQPTNKQQLYEALVDHDIDAIITCAYGMILPQSVLDLAKIDAINVHASLLPNYRGGAPVHHAIMDGQKKTGITIMKMVKKMDAGDMYVAQSIDIEDSDTTSSLLDRLSTLAYQMILSHINDILDQKLHPIPQDEAKVTYAPIITRELEHINMNQSGEKIYNHIRALLNQPGGYVIIDGQKVKLFDTIYKQQQHKHPINTVVSFTKEACVIAVEHGLLYVSELQVESKKRMHASQLWHGIGKNWMNKEVI